jgi:hypothetical protein
MQALQYFATLTVLGGAGQNDATGKHSACGGDPGWILPPLGGKWLGPVMEVRFFAVSMSACGVLWRLG